MLIRLFQYQDCKINNFFSKAYDQPDVYETFELPEDDQQLDYAEEVRFNMFICLCYTVIRRKYMGMAVTPKSEFFVKRILKLFTHQSTQICHPSHTINYV